MKRLATLLATAALAAPVTACVTDELEIDDGETVKSEDGKTDASALAVFLDMEFQGTLLGDVITACGITAISNYTVFGRPLMASMDSRRAVTLAILVAAPVLLPFQVWRGQPHSW